MQKFGIVLLATLATLSILGIAATPAQSTKSKSSTKPQAKKTSNSAKSAKSSDPKKVAAKDTDKSKQSKFESVPSRREELRGIWITTDSPRDWDAVMKKLKDCGLNAAFVRVAQGGKAIYPSSILPQDQWAADTGEDELEKAVDAAHRHGIQIHAWKVVFPMGAAKFRPPGSDAHEFFDRMAREDRLLRTAKGTQTSWLNPADPRNHDLEARVAGEIVERYNVDGYHLDYIRYPASEGSGEPGFDAHYDPVARREFEKSLGRAVKNWPADVASGPLKLQYEDWERDNITRVVRKIRAEVKSKRPNALLSAAVWRKVHLYRTWIKQDWPRWCREGLLDFVIPMCYDKDLDEFRTVLARDFSHVNGRVPFVAGIGNYRIYSADGVVDQVQAAREIGADGFVLFSINDPTDEANPKVYYKGLVDRQLAALAAGATKSPASPNLGGPRLDFGLSPDIVARRYQTFAAEAGQISQVTVRLPKTPAVSGELRLTATIEDLKGRKIGDVQNVTLKPGGEQSLPVANAVVPVRLVVRGKHGSNSDPRPFVLRGPIIEPVSHSEIAELRDRAKPPRPPSSGLRVGVYYNGLGSEGIFDALSQSKGIAPVWIYHIEPSHLASVEVFILPQLFELTDLTPQTIKSLRHWVESGGRIILTHDAVGLRWHPRVFPEVGHGTKLVASRSVQTQLALRGFAKGIKFDHEYTDHAQLELLPSTNVLVTEQKTNKPVVAAGRVGKGLVILNGLIPGYNDEADADSNSAKLLIGLVNYR
jgi:uncharacterized lipoprotein YddW (UPF0748 family)